MAMTGRKLKFWWCVAGGVVASVCLGALAGCRDAGTGQQKVMVRMWTFPMLPELRDHELYRELAEEFEREHPDIRVQVEMLPWAGRIQKIITALAGRRAPDAVYLNLDLMPRLVDRGALRPVDEFVSEEMRTDYGEVVVDAVTMDGSMWMFPMLRTVSASLYNKDLFEKAGLDPEKPPRNWEELEHAARALTRDFDGDGHMDQWGLGYVLGGDTLNMSFWPLLWQAGGEVLTPDSSAAAFNGPEGVEALSLVVRLFKAGCIPKSFLALGGSEFVAGKLGYYHGVGQLEAKQFLRDAPNLRIGVGPVLEHRRRMSYSTIGGFAMFSTTKHPRETAEWLLFLSRPDIMRKYCRATMFLPTRQSLGSIFEHDPILSKLEQETPYLRPDVKSIYARQIMQMLVPEIQAAVLGRKSPEAALNDAGAAVNAMLKADRP
jgi:multiple sugar transport system substrate-binding protein